MAMVRITRSYDVLRQIISDWACKVDKIIVYEHPADGKVKKAHVHILMCGMSVTWDAMKKAAIKNHQIAKEFAGNGDWSKKKDYEYRPLDTIKYMSKGQYDPVYNKGYTDEEVATAKAAWVPAQEHMTKDQELYYRFCGGDDKEKQYESSNWLFDRTKQEARNFAFWECKRIWTARAGQIARMLIFTHHMNYGFILPDSWETRM